MNLHSVIVPRVGPFRGGAWNGCELVVVQRRWFPAIICWVLSFLMLGWLAAGIAFPASTYVPDKDQAGPVLVIAMSFAVIGGIIAMWKRIWRVNPRENTLECGSGFFAKTSARVEAEEGLWVQLHPVSIAARRSVAWTGYGAVIHVDNNRGVVVAVTKIPDEAIDVIEQLRNQLEIRECEIVGQVINAAA